MTKQEFITAIAGYVEKYAPSYGIKVHSPIIAQAILESGWGESKLASQYHNYFGLKCGTKWTGKSVNMTTKEEYTEGTLTTIKDNFRVFDSMEEGVKGYFEFIQLARYQNLRGITDPKKYLETIKADGYATSSTYVTNTMKLVTQYELTKYDKEAETTMSKTRAAKTTTVTKKVSASKYASSFDKTLAASYTTTANLNMRDGAGTTNKVLTVLPKGTVVKNYGYYSVVNGTKWLYVQVTLNSVQYTGFCSGKYLKK